MICDNICQRIGPDPCAKIAQGTCVDTSSLIIPGSDPQSAMEGILARLAGLPVKDLQTYRC
jgi:hypothetical protein